MSNKLSGLCICLSNVLVLLFFLFPHFVQAQHQDAGIADGYIKGKVKDSVYNFMLISATVAVYTDADSSLLQFTLPNSFGEFTVSSLPIGVSLRLIITHVGYTPLFRKFMLTREKRGNDLGLLYMRQRSGKDDNILKEVVIKAIPPIRMNGDTLEFNADAFKMDANATAEDLMRRLPGFTVWGDGEITFNGKKINAIYVEGKPFMGSTDPKIATQNLPKDALDKLQVYQQRNEKNPLDSTMFANIKLKDDKKMGYFGKLSAGYGSAAWSKDKKERYAVDGMLSRFNKKLQISAVGAFNNINKLAGNTDILLRNTTFKGEGANAEYQSDFNMRGLNKPLAAGLKMQYDFIPDVQYQKSSRLNIDYFLNNNRAVTNDSTLTHTFLGNDTLLSRRSVSNNYHQSTGQNFNTNYELNAEKFNLNVYASLNANTDKNNSQNQATQEKTGKGIISNSNSIYENENNGKSITLGASYTNRNNYWSSTEHRIPRGFTIGYNFFALVNNGVSYNHTQYTSSLNQADNRIFDRRYTQRDTQRNTHDINVSYPGLKRLIFNKKNLGGIEIKLSANYTLTNNTNIDEVQDMDTLAHIYRINHYLTNTRNTNLQNFIPSLSFSKIFSKILTNRYDKWVDINLDFKQQYYGLQSEATQKVQNFSYWYAKFVPTASVEYYNHQYGSYEVRYKLNFFTSVIYPSVQNISPLVDSSDYWYIPKGNPHIKPQYKKELSAGYEFKTRTSKNPFQFNISIAVGKIEDNITDSTLYNNKGVRTVYAVNIDGNRYIYGTAKLKKSLELYNKSAFNATASYSFYKGRNPQFINTVLNVSNSNNHDMQFGLDFRHGDLVTLKAEEGLNFYNSTQTGFNNNVFNSRNGYTRFICSLQLPKNLVWGTNITYNKSNNNTADAVYYTIWNASLTYRFLKGNRGEIKFAALDLLLQNKGIVNTSSINTQTFTTSNVLQQYYILTLSYYPRKFGK